MKFSHLSLYKHHDKVSDDKGCPKQNVTILILILSNFHSVEICFSTFFHRFPIFWFFKLDLDLGTHSYYVALRQICCFVFCILYFMKIHCLVDLSKLKVETLLSEIFCFEKFLCFQVLADWASQFISALLYRNFYDRNHATH